MATICKSSEKSRPMLSYPNGFKPIWTELDIQSKAKNLGPLLLAISGINEWRRFASQVKRAGQCYHTPTDLNRFGQNSTFSPKQKTWVPFYWQFQESMNGDDLQVK